jgi:uncharacterized membrane protein
MSQQGGPELRIGDAEREAAVGALGEHYAAGRLTKEEFDERSDRAWAARTSTDLWPLFADLPRPRTMGATARSPEPARPQPERRGHQGWWLRAAFVPVLVVVLVLTVLTHLPLFLLVVLVWVLLTRTHRGWGAPRYHHGRRARFR